MHFVVAVCILIVDQVTKWLAQQFLPLGVPVPLLPPVLYLTYVRNPGAAFTMLANQRWLLVSVALLVGITTFIYRKLIAKQKPLVKWSLTIALSGATGNLIDRLRFGKVIDFLDTRVWPVFNVADSCIVIGVCVLIWVMLRDKETWGGQ